MIFLILTICLFNTACSMTLVEEYIEHYTGVQKKDISKPLEIKQPFAKSTNQEFSLYSTKLQNDDNEVMYVYQLFHINSNTPIDYWVDSSQWKHALINNSGTQVITKRTRFQYNNTNDVTGDNSDFWVRTITYENNQKKFAKSKTTVLSRQLDLKFFLNEDVVISLETRGSRVIMVAWDITNKFSTQDLLPAIAINHFEFNPIISSKSFDSDRMFIADTDSKENPQQLMIQLWNIKTGKSEQIKLFDVKKLMWPLILAVSATKRYVAVSSGKCLISFDVHNNKAKFKTLPQNANHIYFDNKDWLFCMLPDGKQVSFGLDPQATQ